MFVYLPDHGTFCLFPPLYLQRAVATIITAPVEYARLRAQATTALAVVVQPALAKQVLSVDVAA